MSRVLEIANPFHRRWFFALPHAVLIAALVAIAFVAGVFSGGAIERNGGFYRSHYKASLPIPTTHVRITAHVGALPSLGSIHFKYANFQINDQGQEGSCQSWAFDKQESYAYNWNFPHHYRFYSPRFPYDIASAGFDNGSYLEQYPPIVQQNGNPTWAEMPFGQQAYNVGLQPYGVDYPVAPAFYSAAAAHRLNLYEQSLFQNPGAGAGGLALIKQAIASHHMVNLDLPVYPEYDAANQTGSTVTLPTYGESPRGGHANDGVIFNDYHVNGDGTDGAILASNQWGWNAGVGRDGIRHTDGTKNGYVWLSYGFVEQEVWGAAVIHVGTGSTAKAHRLQLPLNGPADGGKRPLPPPSSGKPQPGSASGWYVKPFYTRDTGQNISPIINATGDYYHIWPVYILAVVFAESGGYTGVSSERFATWPDWSCGLMQQIIANVTAHTGITDTRTACNWEENPTNSIQYGTQLLREYMNETGVGYPALWQCYNAGPGSCRSPYYAGFLSNYYVALGYATNQPGPHPSPPPPPPTPKPRQRFPLSKWCHWTARHHRACPSPRWHGHLGTVPREWAFNKKSFGKDGHPRSVCRGILKGEEWNAQRRVMKTSFAGCTVFSWPQFRHDPTLWYRGRH